MLISNLRLKVDQTPFFQKVKDQACRPDRFDRPDENLSTDFVGFSFIGLAKVGRDWRIQGTEGALGR